MWLLTLLVLLHCVLLVQAFITTTSSGRIMIIIGRSNTYMMMKESSSSQDTLRLSNNEKNTEGRTTVGFGKPYLGFEATVSDNSNSNEMSLPTTSNSKEQQQKERVVGLDDENKKGLLTARKVWEEVNKSLVEQKGCFRNIDFVIEQLEYSNRSLEKKVTEVEKVNTKLVDENSNLRQQIQELQRNVYRRNEKDSRIQLEEASESYWTKKIKDERLTKEEKEEENTKRLQWNNAIASNEDRKLKARQLEINNNQNQGSVVEEDEKDRTLLQLEQLYREKKKAQEEEEQRFRAAAVAVLEEERQAKAAAEEQANEAAAAAAVEASAAAEEERRAKAAEDEQTKAVTVASEEEVSENEPNKYWNDKIKLSTAKKELQQEMKKEKEILKASFCEQQAAIQAEIRTLRENRLAQLKHLNSPLPSSSSQLLQPIGSDKPTTRMDNASLVQQRLDSKRFKLLQTSKQEREGPSIGSDNPTTRIDDASLVQQPLDSIRLKLLQTSIQERESPSSPPIGSIFTKTTTTNGGGSGSNISKIFQKSNKQIEDGSILSSQLPSSTTKRVMNTIRTKEVVTPETDIDNNDTSNDKNTAKYPSLRELMRQKYENNDATI